MTRPRVAVVHNFPAPYRMPLFERLLLDNELQTRLFLTSSPSGVRPGWTADESSLSDKITYLPEIGVAFFGRTGDKVRLNTGISRVFSWKPDVVLIYGYNEPTNLIVALVCKIKRIPYVLFAETAQVERQSLRRRLFHHVFGLVIRNASHLAPASKSCALFFASEGGREESMTEVPCVPDVQELISISARLRDGRSRTREKFHFDNRFILLFAGRFLRVKGVEDLFEALDLAIRQDPNILLVIVGYGPMEDDVKRQCELHPNNSVYLGYVEEETLHELLSVADLHVMPSWYEGYGVTCAQALSFGVPSLVTETSGCKDLIVDGVNGFVVRPKEPDSIAASILKISQNPRLLGEMKSKANMIVREYDMDNLHHRLRIIIQATLSRY